MTGRDLRKLRETCGVTREELAATLGWGLGSVSYWEADTVPDTRAAHDIVRALAGIVRARTPVVVLGAPPSRAP